MRLFPPVHDAFITIQCKPQELICSWIEQTSDTSFTVKGYQKTVLHDLELEQLVLFNPTRIKKYIVSFLQKYDLHCPVAAIGLSGPALKEKLIISKESPTLEQFDLEHASQWFWDSTYLYTDSQQRQVYYACAIKRATLFMYQLLAINLSLNVVAITSERMALFALYKFLYADAFRNTQLGIDMVRHNNMLEQLFFPEYAYRILNGTITLTQRMELLPACGLYTLKEAE